MAGTGGVYGGTTGGILYVPKDDDDGNGRRFGTPTVEPADDDDDSGMMLSRTVLSQICVRAHGHNKKCFYPRAGAQVDNDPLLTCPLLSVARTRNSTADRAYGVSEDCDRPRVFAVVIAPVCELI